MSFRFTAVGATGPTGNYRELTDSEILIELIIRYVYDKPKYQTIKLSIINEYCKLKDQIDSFTTDEEKLNFIKSMKLFE